MDDRVRPILEAGFGAHQAGELEIAEGNYRHALTIEPANSDALHLLGVLLMQKGNIEAAICSIKDSIEIDPENPSALDHLGVMLADTGELKEAIVCFTQALYLAPDYGSCWRNFGYAKELARDWSGAIEAYQKAIELEHNYAAAHAALGGALLHIGAFEDALETFNTAILLDPSHKPTLVKRAEVLRRLKHFSEAIIAYREIFSQPSDKAYLAQYLGFCHLEGGNDIDALTEFNAALRLQPNMVDSALGAAGCLMRQGNLETAAMRLNTVLRHTPGHTQAMTYKTILHQLAGEKDKAAQITNLNRDISIVELPLPEGYVNKLNYTSDLAEALNINPTLRTDPPAKSTRGGQQSGELSIFDNPIVESFVSTLHQFLQEYLASLTPQPNHPHFRAKPNKFRLDCWSTLLNAEGYQLPHNHPSAWLSGVYYVQLPPEIKSADETHAGWIEFGASGYGLPDHSGPLRLITPKVGHMVLFPSYFLHRTVPFHSDTQRISIAFDIVPI
ncbi:MAG: putative 2OG-Fe(II) oxygenase [Pseudomonadota bacterium]|nr:putative 2OG-Fe(II) oxygenase [Pseudomonadota bacterium]